MKTRIRTGGQTKIKLNKRIAEPAGIRDQDIYEMDVSPEQIVLRKSQQEQ